MISILSLILSCNSAKGRPAGRSAFRREWIRFLGSLSLSLSLSLFSLLPNCQSSQTIYLGPDGNDKNEGTQNAPLKNPETAIRMAEQIRKENPGRDIEICMLDGEYHLKRTIKIMPNLSGIKLMAENENTVTIKGSKLLSANWQQVEDNIWMTRIEEGLRPEQLFINSRKQILARYPNYDENVKHWNGYAADAISAERIKTGKNLSVLLFMPCMVANGEISIM